LQLTQISGKSALTGAIRYGLTQLKRLRPYLDEHAFRHNRRKTKGVGRLVARCLENMFSRQPLTMRLLRLLNSIDTHTRVSELGAPWFASSIAGHEIDAVD
jgi:hypothetical protein